jgi:S1-C subfamily serine protease/Flp pilus assembly protein TadD
MNETSIPKKRARYSVSLLLVAVTLMPHLALALTGSQVYERVKDSVVVVMAYDRAGKAVGMGSGVVLPSGNIATNYHVVKAGVGWYSVGQRDKTVPAALVGCNPDKDLAILNPIKEIELGKPDSTGRIRKHETGVVEQLPTIPARLGQTSRLKVGDRVYAVGAPQGLELSLSEGIVSQLRGGVPPLIQTTAAVSPGSSGGGLFNAEGELVGITTFKWGGENLNFALPVEWVREIATSPKQAQKTQEPVYIEGYVDELQTQGGRKRPAEEWLERSWTLVKAQDWRGYLAHCRQWIQAEPSSYLAWSHLGGAYFALGRRKEAIQAYQESLRLKPDDVSIWNNLGLAYIGLGRHQEAISAYREALRHKPDANSWYNLGNAYADLGQYREAIEAYRKALRLKPDYLIVSSTWYYLSIAYARSGNRAEALKAVNELRRYNPQNADELLNQIIRP